MTYAITGSNGFIGTALVQRLMDNSHTVIEIPRWMIHGVTDLKKLLREKNVEVVFHLAAYGNHYNQTHDNTIIQTNVMHSLNVFKAAEGRKVYNFSTSSVMLKKQTLYSITKYATEQMAGLFENVVNIRPYSVYGPGEADHRLIPVVINCLLNDTRMHLDENATHDWIYIDDFLNNLAVGHTEIGTGTKRSNLELVRILEQISGKKLSYVPGRLRLYDQEDWVCHSPVQCHWSIEAGLLRCWQHYSKKYSQ